jgi:hypothetical protein
MTGEAQRIVVCGDAAIDLLQWQSQPEFTNNNCDTPNHNWLLFSGFQNKKVPGGSLLFANMVSAACRAEVISQYLEDIDSIPPEKVIHSLAILDKYPLSPEQKDAKDTIYRVKQFCGFSGPATEPPKPLSIQNDNSHATLVVIDDTGNGFRDERDVWPLSIKTENEFPYVILKMSRPLATGDLWDNVSQNHAKKLIVIISANDLRECSINISHSLSWERTAEDFMWQITNNPDIKIKELAECSNLIVRFGLDGAILYSNKEGKKDARLYFYPKGTEDSFKDQYKGEMQGVTIAFAAALSAHIDQNGLANLGEGIKEGIKKSRALFTLGFGKDPKKTGYPIEDLFDMNKEDPTFIADISISDLNNHRSMHKQPWTILEKRTHGKLVSVANNMVIDGTDPSLRCVPEGKFGGLRTIERTEIESYQSIKNLMIEFLERKKQTTPLCIAVFGPPGSGKSFGVTQLAESVARDQVKKLEFNVSQFKSITDLVNAFHKVRDLVLEGKIPLVFFDEFDSYYDQNFLGWLKYFLAPMQDGVFKDGEMVHPIGKSIFVFAGGTSSTFEKFSRDDGYGTVSDEERNKFREAKGIDFISRLRGYVNIMGPNQNGDDVFYVIRRALLFRSFLEKSAPGIFDSDKIARIDPGVLRALITIPTYKHGVRSMMAIIEMSRLKERRVFEQAALPSEKQLDLHVNGNLFVRLALQDVFKNDAIERLAISIYEHKLEEEKLKKSASDAPIQPWNTLDKTAKQTYREKALHMHKQLVSTGFDFDLLLISPDAPLDLSRSDIESLILKDPTAQAIPNLIASAGIKLQRIDSRPGIGQ